MNECKDEDTKCEPAQLGFIKHGKKLPTLKGNEL